MPKESAREILAEVMKTPNHYNQHAVPSGREGRVVLADGMEPLPAELSERYESILDAYSAKIEDMIERNMESGAGQSIFRGRQTPAMEQGFPGHDYSWWHIFLVGPIQRMAKPPFSAHKIIAAGKPAFFLAFIVKNPQPGAVGSASALTLLKDRKFELNGTLLNMTKVSTGPEIVRRAQFDSRVVQPFLLVFRAPQPRQRKPDLYEINLTASVIDGDEPLAAFATGITDLDREPDAFPFLPDCRRGCHLHARQPLRFLVYNA